MSISTGGRAPLPAAKVRPPKPTGLRRDRLEVALVPGGDGWLGLVVAPAGSGKSTLLAQLAAGWPGRVAWYRAETSDAHPDALLDGLRGALGASGPAARPAGPWHQAEDLVAELETDACHGILLAVDDAHAVAGTPAEEVLERLIECRPPGVHLLLASRLPLSFDLTRRRLAGGLVEIGAEELRFRTWEVERLFAQIYGRPLAPEDLADLARRSGGWAAALHLFHLATKDRPAHERRQTLGHVGQSRLVGEYLARHVIGGLPPELSGFLLETSLLGRLSAPLCDAFLDTTGSARLLEELAQRQILVRSPHDDLYRCHEVLRGYLEAALVERAGEASVRERCRRAAGLLEAAGALPEALHAWSRAEDWEAVARLLGHDGDEISADPGRWLDLLPLALRHANPWLLLATARQHRAAGRWEVACQTYRMAEAAFGDSTGAERSRRERQALACWLDADFVPPPDSSAPWHASLLAALRRRPDQPATLPEGDDPQSLLAAGLGLLVAGRVREARATLNACAEHPGASRYLCLGARVGGAAAGLLMGDPLAAGEAMLAAEDAETLGVPWLSRIGRALLALSGEPGGRSEAAAARLMFERMGDAWGAGLAALMEGLGTAAGGRLGDDLLARATESFRLLGAPPLEAWCGATRAVLLAREGDTGAADAARRAELAARGLGLPGPLTLAYRALAAATPERAEPFRLAALDAARDSGLTIAIDRDDPPATNRPTPRLSQSGPDTINVRVLGGFFLHASGQAIELAGLKPRARELLRLLLAHSGDLLHREVILEALWPDTPPESGMRNLQVAISSLRRALGHALPPGPNRRRALAVERDADAYRLDLTGVELDLLGFERAVDNGEAARRAGNPAAAITELTRALDYYRGDLLPEDGPVEWVVDLREQRRWQAVWAARGLAELLLAGSDPVSAARVCQRGLLIDRDQDALWRMLLQAHEQVPNPLAAARARRRYHEVLEGLDCVP